MPGKDGTGPLGMGPRCGRGYRWAANTIGPAKERSLLEIEAKILESQLELIKDRLRKTEE